MTLRLSPAELHTLQGQPPRQLNLFKGRRQRGVRPKPALEFKTACVIADTMRRWGHPDWQFNHFPAGELRSVVTGARLKRMGLRPGWPDFILLSPAGMPHFLELKRKGGRMSEAQKAFAEWCVSRPLVVHHVAYDADDALKTLIAWGALKMDYIENFKRSDLLRGIA